MKTVFISSVMRDFEQQRAAARTAVESLRQKPMMAEDFGAKPFSSQVACAEGVRQSDIYLGILGPRYGHVTGAGISVTEEEFNEARRRGHPVLWFVQKGDREPEQQKFLDRIGAYSEGYFIKFFASAQELQAMVTASLFDQLGQVDVANLDRAGAIHHIAKYVKLQPNPSEHTSYLTGIIFPVRQGEEYLSPLDLSRKDFKDAVMQRAMFGATAVLKPGRETDTVEGQNHLAFVQRDRHQRLEAAIEMHCDGTLVLTTALGADGRDQGMSGLVSYVIDQQETGDRLASFLTHAEAFYRTLEASPLLSSFYAATFLKNLNYKTFGQRPKTQQSMMSMPTSPLPDPMMIPAEPQKIARAELNDCPAIANKFIALAERAFKSHNRYYGTRS